MQIDGDPQMPQRPRESDWKIYSRCVPEWRERYLSGINLKIAGILANPSRTPTEQFWDAKEKMEVEARTLTDCLDDHSRSKMLWHLVLMSRHGMINEADLKEFSDQIQRQVAAALST